MNGLRNFCGLFLIVILLAVTVSAQTGGLPRLKKGEDYNKVRAKMIKAGWKPFQDKNADQCGDTDPRCQDRPEMQSVSAKPLGECIFLWKRNGKTAAIITIGEDTEYERYKFVKPPNYQ